MRYIWILPVILSTIGLIYAEVLKDFLQSRGLLKFGLERSELEKVTAVRGILVLIITISLIFFTGVTQLIVGAIGILLGSVIMYYSEPIYRLFATGRGNSRFRGDDKIKLVGLVLCIVSAGWMSGITQAILYGFLSVANIIPQSDLIEYY